MEYGSIGISSTPLLRHSTPCMLGKPTSHGELLQGAGGWRSPVHHYSISAYSLSLLKSCAFAATITVLADMKTAPRAGGRMIP
jgi:hypothetical protein